MTAIVSTSPAVVIAVEIVDGEQLDRRTAGVVGAAASALRAAASAVRDGERVSLVALVPVLCAAESALAGPARRARLAASEEAATNESRVLGRDDEETLLYDRFFGVARAATLTPVEEVASAASCVVQVVADLDRVRLSAEYVAEVIELFARSYGELADVVPTSVEPGGADADATGPDPLRPLDRWWLGHQVYAIANRRAARLLRQAATATGSTREAALVAAAPEIAAITASLNYTAAMSSRQYQQGVRPMMAEPNLELELSGRMNLDHATYRAALGGLLAALLTSYAELAATAPRVAAARDRVLDLDLHDMCCHVELTHRLVGAAAALDEQEQGSAVIGLRAMELRRTQDHAPYLRLGDRLDRPVCPDPSSHRMAGLPAGLRVAR